MTITCAVFYFSITCCFVDKILYDFWSHHSWSGFLHCVVPLLSCIVSIIVDVLLRQIPNFNSLQSQHNKMLISFRPTNGDHVFPCSVLIAGPEAVEHGAGCWLCLVNCSSSAAQRSLLCLSHPSLSFVFALFPPPLLLHIGNLKLRLSNCVWNFLQTEKKKNLQRWCVCVT